MKISRGWSSHLPVLYRIMPLITGDVLELGIGFFSTSFLHWMCEDRKLRLVSFEKEPGYFKWFKNFKTRNHNINLVDDWDKIDINQHWGLVFIDHNDERRPIEAIRVANNADYVIIHDTQDENYNDLKAVWSHFKYVKHFDQFSPRTTILSNFYEVKDL